MFDENNIDHVKAYYYFDCMFNMKFAKIWIRKGLMIGWVELYKVLQKRKEFNEKIEQLRKSVKN